MASRQTLDEWVHEALTDPDKKEPCTRIVLIHRQGVRELELHTTQIGSRQWSAKDLANMLHSKAQNYAAELPGMQTFCLLAFYGESPQWGAIRPFQCPGQEELPGLGTEAPSKEGLVQQAMRHTEAMTQMAMRQTNAMCQSMNQMFDQVVRENISLRKENMEAMAVVRDAIMRLTTSANESAMKRLEYERTSQERSQWLGLIPALANGLLDREVFPQETADSVLMREVAENLTEEDFRLLSKRLRPEVMAPLAKRFAKILADKRGAKDQAARALASVDPEEDATGLAHNEAAQ